MADSLGPAPAYARQLPTMSSVADSQAKCTDIDEPRAATHLPYKDSANWQPVAGAPFPSGLAGTTGFLRIPSFDEERFAPACRQIKESDPHLRRLANRAALNRLLLDRIAALKAGGMKRLVIDLSGNGGGSEWSSELAALLATGTLQRPAPRLVVRSCDRSGVWRGEKVCSPYAPASVETQSGKGAWTGPIATWTTAEATAVARASRILAERGTGRIAGQATGASRRWRRCCPLSAATLPDSLRP